MGFLENIVSGVVSAISATAILTLFAIFWRRRVILKYNLNQTAKRVLAALWDEGLIRPPTWIATELNMQEDKAIEVDTVVAELNELRRKGLARIRKIKDNERDHRWKITWNGKEYLSQLSWLGDLA